MSACFRYVEITNFERFQRENNITVNTDMSELENALQLQHLMRLYDIFEYTPFSPNVFEECVMRIPRYYSYQHFSGKDCLSMFEVSRFFTQEFICYRFNVINDTIPHYFRNPAYAQTYPNTIYLIKLNASEFKTADEIKIIVHEANTIPFRSTAFSPLVFREYDARNQGES